MIARDEFASTGGDSDERVLEIVSRDLEFAFPHHEFLSRDLDVAFADHDFVIADLEILSRECDVVFAVLDVVFRDLELLLRDLGVVFAARERDIAGASAAVLARSGEGPALSCEDRPAR